jgi:hypothetical protein
MRWANVPAVGNLDFAPTPWLQSEALMIGNLPCERTADCAVACS